MLFEMSMGALSTYFGVIVIVSIVPGPSMMLAFTEGLVRGVSGALPAAAGNTAASLLQALIAFGLFRSTSSLPHQVQVGIEALGSVYVAYVGLVFIMNGRRMSIEENPLSFSSRSCLLRFGDGFLIAFFNPKAILFFLALFPQFIEMTSLASARDLCSVLLPVGIGAPLCFVVYSLMGQTALRAFSARQIFGIIVPGLGVILLGFASYALVALAPRLHP